MTIRTISEIDPDYEIIKIVRSGKFCTVSQARRLCDSKIMACKSTDCLSNPGLRDFVNQEINALVSLGTKKYIAKISNDASWDPVSHVLRTYMDFYDGGDLQAIIDACKFDGHPVHPVIASYWAIEIARAITTCHDHGTVHRNIKPKNILLDRQYDFNRMLWKASKGQDLDLSDWSMVPQFVQWFNNRQPWCYLTGFGVHEQSAEVNEVRSTKASSIRWDAAEYAAPEALEPESTYSFKSDIYSLGRVLLTLYDVDPQVDMTKRESLDGLAELLYIKDSPRLVELIKRCIDINPDSRPNSREVLDDLNDVFCDLITSENWIDTLQMLTGKTSSSISLGSSASLSNMVPPNSSTIKQERKLLQNSRMKNNRGFGNIEGLLQSDEDIGEDTPEGTPEDTSEGPPKQISKEAGTTTEEANKRLQKAIQAEDVVGVENALADGARGNYVYNKTGQSLLFLACLGFSPKIVDRLLDHEVGTSFMRLPATKNPFGAAISTDRVTIVEVFLKRKLANLESPYRNTVYPILTAATNGSFNVLKWMIANGASTRDRDSNGTCAIHCASWLRNPPKVIEYILQVDPESIELETYNGSTALHLAAQFRRKENIRVLAAAKADPFAKDDQGRTPRDRATDPSICKLLQQMEESYSSD
jgi:serine/threonine protein kinase